jgi:putative DNA primase/helicase
MTIKEIKSQVDILAVVEKYVKLTKKGAEFVGLCPFHNDTNPSFAVIPRKQIFKCHGCGEGGDVIDFVEKFERCTTKEAADKLMDGDVLNPHFVQLVKDKPDAPTWVYCASLDGAPEPDFQHYKHGEPSLRWQYNDTYYVCRFDTDEGKDVLPYTLQTDGNTTRWMWKGHPAPRPLYNLANLIAHPKRQVVLVEGEKTCDALDAVLGDKVVVCTWAGGTGGIYSADFNPLIGRDVVYLPDNDVQGFAAMHYIYNVVGGSGRLVQPPKDALKKWDFADSNYDAAAAIEWMKSHIIEWTRWVDCPAWAEGTRAMVFNMFEREGGLIDAGNNITMKMRPETPMLAVAAPEPTVPTPPPAPRNDTPYFQFLGYNESTTGSVEHYVYDVRSRKIHTFSPSRLNKAYMMQIAPLTYWEGKYPAKNGADWDAAADHFVALSYSSGLFNPDTIRGRGAWMDGSRLVVHAGKHLFVDGAKCEPDGIDSTYIYKYDLSYTIADKAADKRDTVRLLDALKLLRWERDVNSHLLAGWLMIAPFSGALRWRPHIWVSGPAGTGKSTLAREVILKILKGVCVNAQGETSAAGIRQKLGSDAIPVVFDEADVDTKNDAMRMDQVLALARGSSSETDADVLKGTASHSGLAFKIRSSFCFLSVVFQASRQADLGRISLLTLRQDGSDKSRQDFNAFENIVHDLITTDFVAALRRRAIDMMPTILTNTKVFEKVARDGFVKSARAADQIAPMLAGAYALAADGVISEKKARDFMSQHDWSEEVITEESSDQDKCLDAIMQHTVDVEGEHGRVNRTIGELVDIAMGDIYTVDNVNKITAESRLLRFGIKTDGVATFTISNAADGVIRALAGTPWVKSHGKVLIRLDGAERTPPQVFAKGSKQSRGVKIKKYV